MYTEFQYTLRKSIGHWFDSGHSDYFFTIHCNIFSSFRSLFIYTYTTNSSAYLFSISLCILHIFCKARLRISSIPQHINVRDIRNAIDVLYVILYNTNMNTAITWSENGYSITWIHIDILISCVMLVYWHVDTWMLCEDMKIWRYEDMRIWRYEERLT